LIPYSALDISILRKGYDKIKLNINRQELYIKGSLLRFMLQL